MSRSVEDFLTAWMSSTLPGQWLWIPARQCSVAPRKSDATVSTTEHSRFYSCWWMCSTPLDYCICDILQDLVYKGRRLSFANIQDLKEAIKNKINGHWDSSKIHCTMEKRLNAVRKQNGGATQHIFRKSLWLDIDLMQSEVLNLLVIFCTFRTPNTFLCISLSKQKRTTS